MPNEGIPSRERKKYLPYDKFQTEVTNLYSGKESIVEWYRKEQPNHSNWPFNPDIYYREKGWIDWPELVDRENRYKRELLVFDDLKTEFRKEYEGGDIARFYHRKRKAKNHSYWPAVPERDYPNEWKGWSDLAGKENEKKWLIFKDFKNEVVIAYSMVDSLINTDIRKWYRQERVKHADRWPSHPDEVYDGRGWENWENLVKLA